MRGLSLSLSQIVSFYLSYLIILCSLFMAVVTSLFLREENGLKNQCGSYLTCFLSTLFHGTAF